MLEITNRAEKILDLLQLIEKNEGKLAGSDTKEKISLRFREKEKVAVNEINSHFERLINLLIQKKNEIMQGFTAKWKTIEGDLLKELTYP